ncbi:terpene synthase family protein [Nocardia wallacei]|uniref:terpene synthase family protein n=1 Tax=Nocardia wallacei TaxID=480035 RepID=UPI002454B3EF|nr:hypothetical protein [Nocardia wallacei]
MSAASTLPAIYCPIPRTVHPQTASVDAHSVEWMRSRPCFAGRVSARLERADVGGLASAFFPHGKQEALEAISDFFCWGFAFDDLIESLATSDLAEAADRQFGLLRVLDAPESALPTADPFTEAFIDIARRFARLAAPAVWRRWIGHTRSFAIGVIWACVYRAADRVPRFDEFAVLRPLDAGAPNNGAVLVELAEGFAVPDDQLEHPYLRTVTDILGTILSWDNDICSYLVESEGSLERINLVTVLARHHGISARAAVAEAIHLRNRAMWCYLRHRNNDPFVGRPGHDIVRGYVNSLDNLISGNLHWSMAHTSRYHTAAPLLDLTLHTCPADDLGDRDLTRPIESPGLRWWWAELSR